jgi:hypothetical protein
MVEQETGSYVCCCWPIGKHCQLYFTFITLSAKKNHAHSVYFSNIFSQGKRKEKTLFCFVHGVTKRCRLYWLTNSTLAYGPNCRGGGGVEGSQPMGSASNSKFTYGFVPSSILAMKLFYLQFFQRWVSNIHINSFGIVYSVFLELRFD